MSTSTSHGLDVSVYQSRTGHSAVDWAKAKQPPNCIEWAYVRLANGAAVDSSAYDHIVHARENGIMVGGYLFYQHGQNLALQVTQAIQMHKALNLDLPLALDVEQLPQSGHWQDYLCEVLVAASMCIDAGERPIIYTSEYFLTEFSRCVGAPELAGYPLWIAKYAKTPPKMPFPFGIAVAWQYDGDKGRLLEGLDCDFNVSIYTAKEFAALRGVR